MANIAPAPLPLGATERYPGLYTLLDAISGVLTDLVVSGEQKPPIYNSQTALFFGSQACVYPIKFYLRRICEYSGCSNECFVLMLIYIDRLVCAGRINLTSLNAHRVIITAIMAAAKFFDDEYYFNPFFGTVGGISTQEINQLEVEFLFLMEFNLYVAKQEFERYYNTLAHLAAVKGLILTPNMMPRPLPFIEIAEPTDEEFEHLEPQIPLKNLIREEQGLSKMTSSSTLVSDQNNSARNIPRTNSNLANNVSAGVTMNLKQTIDVQVSQKSYFRGNANYIHTHAPGESSTTNAPRLKGFGTGVFR